LIDHLGQPVFVFPHSWWRAKLVLMRRIARRLWSILAELLRILPTVQTPSGSVQFS
jgi:hypothetical protein